MLPERGVSVSVRLGLGTSEIVFDFAATSWLITCLALRPKRDMIA